MCNLYTLDPNLIAWAEEWHDFLGEELVLAAGEATLANQPWATTVYPKYQGLFFRPINPNDPSAGCEPAVGRWGLVPFFHRGPAKEWKASTNNCRSEDMHEKPSFRQAVKEKRCVIPVRGICEWTGPTGRKTKHTITRADGKGLFIAGLWASHSWQDDRADSYTMVMMETAEGDDMRPFHNRQPVILNREAARVWLDPKGDYRSILRAPPTGTLIADPPEPVAA